MDSLFESRISAKCSERSRHGLESNANRVGCICSDDICQGYLLDAVNHYGLALQLGQKHVYQALPRLLAMWLEFTAISGEHTNEGHYPSGKIFLIC
jgi:hypothetical protein